jgi:hypothetical protein
MKTYRYENQRKAKKEMDCGYWRYANNGNKTVQKAM